MAKPMCKKKSRATMTQAMIRCAAGALPAGATGEAHIHDWVVPANTTASVSASLQFACLACQCTEITCTKSPGLPLGRVSLSRPPHFFHKL
eukprot:395159-Prymnesium_polylepis.1